MHRLSRLFSLCILFPSFDLCNLLLQSIQLSLGEVTVSNAGAVLGLGHEVLGGVDHFGQSFESFGPVCVFLDPCIEAGGQVLEVLQLRLENCQLCVNGGFLVDPVRYLDNDKVNNYKYLTIKFENLWEVIGALLTDPCPGSSLDC